MNEFGTNKLADGLEYENLTTLHPIGVIALVVLGLAMLAVSRPRAVLPFFALACFVSSAQRVVIFTIDFSFLRLMVLVAVVRIAGRGEHKTFRWQSVDTFVVLWLLTRLFAYSLLHRNAPAVIFALGTTFDGVGMYFVFRILIHDFEDVRQFVRGSAWIALLVAIAFACEMATQYNVFSVFGGVRAFTWIREGKLRCQGAFSHPILAGCFWAALLPMWLALWRDTAGGKLRAFVGASSALLIVIACASSTPTAGVFAALLGLGLYAVRARMRQIRRGVVLSLIALHFVMNAPVWHLIARIDLVGGSTGYHRYLLIDNFIRRFHEWFLIGVKSTYHWGWGMFDVTNQYVLEGVRGGVLTLAFFLIVIWKSFQKVGKLWRAQGDDPFRRLFCWALGACLFTQCMQFIAVSYFGQIYLVLFLNLAAIASIPAEGVERKDEPIRAEPARRRPPSLERPLPTYG